jgi:mRNA interferase RelE/StbE
MPYRLAISDEAREQLRALPGEVRANIGYRLQLLQGDFSRDIKKLAGMKSSYRLRVGTYRVLFRLAGDEIQVYSVKKRDEAYE